jgi:ankyrin repeat protein
MSFLLLNGADPNTPDKEGRSPLHIAAINSSSESCALLLKNGAKENQPDFMVKGKTPFTFAMESKNGDCITLLRLAQLSHQGQVLGGYECTKADLIIPEIKIQFPHKTNTPNILSQNSSILPPETILQGSNSDPQTEPSVGLDSVRRSANLMDKYTHLLMEKSLSQDIDMKYNRSSNDNQVVTNNLRPKSLELPHQEGSINNEDLLKKRERGSKPRNKDTKRFSMEVGDKEPSKKDAREKRKSKDKNQKFS